MYYINANMYVFVYACVCMCYVCAMYKRIIDYTGICIFDDKDIFIGI